MVPNIGFPELVLILVIIIVILGPGRLPEVGKALGRMVKAYRKEAYEGLPPPKRERRRAAREREPVQEPGREAAVHAQAPALLKSVGEEAVADPGRRGMFTAVFRVFQFFWKVLRWRRRLP